MKGVIFVSLLTMADEIFGEDIVDEILDTVPLESGGSYTAIGNYPSKELMVLAEQFGKRAGVEPGEFLRRFGRWLMPVLRREHPEFFLNKANCLELLEVVDSEIHPAVCMIHPGTHPPRIDVQRNGQDRVSLTYVSHRSLADFCVGLIQGCADSYGDDIAIEGRDRSAPGQTVIDFSVRIKRGQA